MTLTITSSLRIGLVAGTGVTIPGAVVPAITTDDIFNPDNPTQTLTEMLSGISSAKLMGSASIDVTATGTTDIYTVPAGKILIPTQIIFALTDFEASEADNPTFNVGWTSSDFNDLVDANTPTLSTISELLSFTDFQTSGVNFSWVPAASVVTVNVTDASTFPTHVFNVFVFGFLTSV